MSEEQKPSVHPLLSGRRPIYLAVGATVAGLILLIVFAVLLIRSGDDGEEVQDATPTSALGTLTVATPNVPGEELVVVGVSNGSTISVPVGIPVMLDVVGQQFAVRGEEVPAQGEWLPQISQPTTAIWVYGTVINYVFGLADTAETRALLDRLVPGNLISFASVEGTTYQFTFDSRNVIPTSSSDVFAQTSPGITLVLLGTEGDSRLMVHGRYVVPDASQTDAGTLVELGEPAQIDNLQITVLGTTHLPNDPSAPAGFAFFLIDYELRNLGTTSIDANGLRFSLVDQYGNQYALNALAGQLGNYPLATGAVGAGQLLSATAGYQIPASLNSPSLRWVVEVGGNAGKVEVNLPFSNQQDTQSAIVSILQAEVSLDGTSLLIQGQITNLGLSQLVINTENVSLSSGGTVYLLFANNPGFPWVIEAGQTIPFTVTFQRPQESSALLTILSYPFQLNGLR